MRRRRFLAADTVEGNPHVESKQYARRRPRWPERSRSAAPACAAAEMLESRRLLASVAGEDLFGPAQTVHASGADANSAFAAPHLLDGTNAAFRFAGGAAPQRLSVSHFNAAIHTLRFFDTPSYDDRAPESVTVYYSPLEQLSLTPASYVRLGTFNLPTTDTGGTPYGDSFLAPTDPPDRPRASDPGVDPAATINYAELNGLAVPHGTQSLLLDFGTHPGGVGFGLSEIQAIGYESARRQPDATLRSWGRNVYDKTVASLKVPGSNLFAETANLSGTRSGGNGGFAYVWPATTQFRVLNALARLDPATFRPVLRAYADELHARYWRTAGVGGYRSGVGTGADFLYDDNGHLVVSLAEAFHLTGDRTYLTRAIQTYAYVLSGEDAAGGGGIYFQEGDFSSKDAISTLQAARAGAMLYQLTGQSRFLADATRLLTWANSRIRETGSGLYVERYRLSGTGGFPEGFTLINSTGIALSLNLLLHDATGDAARLREAQRIARVAIPRYTNSSTGAINDEGYWAFELVTALDDLHLRDNDPAWLASVRRAMVWLRANREDPNGHYGALWGRDNYTPGSLRPTWHLNDQAAVAVSYLYTAAVNTVTPPFVTAPGDSIVGFWGATVGGDATSSSAGTGSGQYPAAEGPPRAIDRDAATKYVNYGNGNSGTSSATKGVGTGFYVTPALGPSIVTGIQVATANDRSARDPLTVSVEGTNAADGLHSGTAWTVIADNVSLGIGPDSTRLAYGPVVRFENSTPYRSYRVIIKQQRGAESAVQYGELNLLGARDAAVGHAVAARHVFYNHSAADTPSASRPAAGDDDAIAVDKAALRPGQPATFSNVTSYSRGINGVMLDVAGVPPTRTPTAADFRLEVLSGGTWVPAAAATVSLRRGAGAGGTDRVTLALPDGAVRNTWLKVTALPTLNTALASPDVFYFGNLVGDTGGPGSPRVDALDLVRTRASVGRTSAAALNAADFNRDGRINAVDVAIVRNSQRRSLPLFTMQAATGPSSRLLFEGPLLPMPVRSEYERPPTRRPLSAERQPDLIS